MNNVRHIIELGSAIMAAALLHSPAAPTSAAAEAHPHPSVLHVDSLALFLTRAHARTRAHSRSQGAGCAERPGCTARLSSVCQPNLVRPFIPSPPSTST